MCVCGLGFPVGFALSFVGSESMEERLRASRLSPEPSQEQPRAGHGLMEHLGRAEQEPGM